MRWLAIALLCSPAVAAWVALFVTDSVGILMAVGGAALALGLVAVRLAPSGRRLTVGLICFTALPGTTAVRFVELSRDMPALSVYGPPRAPYIRLGVASQGIAHWDWDRHAALVVNLIPDGEIQVRGRTRTLADLERDLRRTEGLVALRVERDVPWRNVAYVLRLVRVSGRDRVRLAVHRFAHAYWSNDDPEIALLGATSREYWPESEVEIGLSAAEPSDPIELLARRSTPRYWGPRPQQRMVSMPTRTRYRFRESETDDIAAVARWIEAEHPTALDVESRVPWKFVVAVVNQLLAAGIDRIDLGPQPDPDPELKKLRSLPYPD